MIPREILNKIQPIELRTNRIKSGSEARGCARIPTGFRPKAQGFNAGATLGIRPQNVFNRNAVVAIPFSSAARGICCNPVGVDENLIPFTQGSACVATLVYLPESLWDSPMGAIKAADSARLDSSLILHPSSFSPA